MTTGKLNLLAVGLWREGVRASELLKRQTVGEAAIRYNLSQASQLRWGFAGAASRP